MSSRCLDTEQANMRAELPCLGTVSDEYRLGVSRDLVARRPTKSLTLRDSRHGTDIWPLSATR